MKHVRFENTIQDVNLEYRVGRCLLKSQVEVN